MCDPDTGTASNACPPPTKRRKSSEKTELPQLPTNSSTSTSTSGASSTAASATAVAQQTALPSRNAAQRLLQQLPWWHSVDMDGKPNPYVSRMTGECRRIFFPQSQSIPAPSSSSSGSSETEAHHASNILFHPPLKNDLSLWEFVYKTAAVDKDSVLRRQLEEHKLEGVRFELSVPDAFPMKPPMIRVLHPRLSGGFVFKSGAICFEPLTPTGWISTMAIPSLVEALIPMLNDRRCPVKVTEVDAAGRIKGYTREAAEKEVEHIIKYHKGGSSWKENVADMKS